MSILSSKNIKKNKPNWTSLLFNKYFLSVLAFGIWVSFLDGHNLITQYKLKNTIEQLKTEKNNFVNLIAEAKLEQQDLEVNKEKYAREKYFMHKENENVFIILNDKKNK